MENTLREIVACVAAVPILVAAVPILSAGFEVNFNRLD